MYIMGLNNRKEIMGSCWINTTYNMEDSVGKAGHNYTTERYCACENLVLSWIEYTVSYHFF